MMADNVTIEPLVVVYQNPEPTFLPLNDSFKTPTDFDYEEEEFIFDRTYIKAIFITIYTIVFCLCFFDGIRNITAATIREIRAFVDEGLQIKAIAKRKYLLNSQRIKHATTVLQEDGNIGAYLEVVAYSVQGLIRQNLADEEQVEVENEEYLLARLPGNLLPEFNVNGNLLVILVVTMSRRLRSITNFFLANLAVADLCVGVFCVFQNLSIYLITDWVLGDFLCKMYQFITSLSYTASIFILVVICTERYFAIIHPITCKQILTPTRLRLVILAVWVTSALYSAPKFVWVNTITTIIGNKSETVCIANRRKFNSQLFDMINFVFLYVIPLAIMTLLYTRIAVGLWKSSRKLEKQLNACANGQYQGVCGRQSVRGKPADKKVTQNNDGKQLQNSGGSALPNSSSSQNVLKARRGVIRMLIIVVLTFALCNLPFHARKMWQYWSRHYHGDTNFSALLTPLTFLVTYFNSGINPLLYAFLSRNFRRGMRELLLCVLRGRGKDQGQRLQYAVGYHQRHASTRSTMKGNHTTTTVTIINNEGSSECSHEV